MKKFHLRPDGVVTLCRAEEGPCPFGEENHFATVREGAKAFEARKASSPYLEGHRRGGEASSQEVPSAPPAPSRREVFQATTKDLTSAYWARRKAVKARCEEDPTYKYSDEWFTAMKEAKALKHRAFALEEEYLEASPPQEAAALRRAKEERIQKAKEREEERTAAWRARQEAQATVPYSPHPSLDEGSPEEKRKHEEAASRTLRTYTGLSPEALEERLQAAQEEGLSRTDAYRKVFAETPPRSDKPFVYLDLETATMQGEPQDWGALTDVIEVGAVKVWPDGRVERYQELYSPHPDLLKAAGTGLQEVHHISPEMVEGRPVFQEEEGEQQRLLTFLRGSVLTAHNLSFEDRQLSHNLRGFGKALQNGEIEGLDTLQVNRYFNPAAENNSNRALVESTGGTYEGAHRALQDAEMTMNALQRLKGLPEVEA